MKKALFFALISVLLAVFASSGVAAAPVDMEISLESVSSTGLASASEADKSIVIGSTDPSDTVRQTTITATINISNEDNSLAQDNAILRLNTQASNLLADMSPQICFGGDCISTNGQELDLGNIAVGDSVLATIEFTIAEDANSGSYQVGTVVFDSGAGDAKSYTLSYAAESKLAFVNDEIEISIDGDSEDISEGDESDETYPLDDIEIDIEVENLFNDATDIEMEDIEAELEIEEFDDEGDDPLELDDEFDDLDPEDDDRVSFSFDVPYFVQENSYDAIIRVTGEDSNGAEHTSEFEFSIDVRLNDIELFFDRASTIRSTLSCERRNTQAEIRLINIGEDDLEGVTVRVENSALGIYEATSSYELEPFSDDDDDSILSEQINLEIPEDATPGSYTLNFYADYDGSTLVVKESAIEILECPRQEEDEQEEGQDSGIIVDQQPSTQEPIQVQPTIPEQEEEPYIEPVQDSQSSDTLMVVLLLVGNVLLLSLVGVLAYFALKGGKKKKYE